jgi:hypothetical protein
LTARDEWRWADDHGVQRLVHTAELRAALASRVLPWSTLVWREGMAEWAPADSLPELLGAPPKANGAPRKPPLPHRKTLMGTGKPDAPPGEPASLPGPPKLPTIRAAAPPPPASDREETETLVIPDKQDASGARPEPRPLAPTATSEGTQIMPHAAPARPPPHRASAPARPAPPARPALDPTPERDTATGPLPLIEPARTEPLLPTPPPHPVLLGAAEGAMPAPVEAPRERLPPPAPSTPSTPPHAAAPAAQAAPHAATPAPPAAMSVPPAAPATSTPPLPPEHAASTSLPTGAKTSLRPGPLEDPVLVPLASLFAVGGFLVFALVFSFFAGRCSAGPEDRTARAGVARAAAIAQAGLPAMPRPCWVVRQPVRWALEASKSIPFELVATPAGNLAMGYAKDPQSAVGIEVVPATGEVFERFTKAVEGTIDRVSPRPGEPLEFFVSAMDLAGQPRSVVSVPAAPPFVVMLDRAEIGVAPAPTEPAALAWSLDGDGAPEAAQVQPAGDRGYGLTFRRRDAAWVGWLGADRASIGQLAQVVGSGGAVGKPMSGWNGRELAIVFADRPAEGAPWQIRLGHAAPGAAPTETAVIELPKGGPGGDAFAPDIAGLADGRWLLVWTEGTAGSRAVRAQTLAPDFRPLGDPIALSPPAGSFGQGVLGVAGDYVAAVFLLRGEAAFELWGSVLRCG